MITSSRPYAHHLYKPVEWLDAVTYQINEIERMSGHDTMVLNKLKETQLKLKMEILLDE